MSIDGTQAARGSLIMTKNKLDLVDVDIDQLHRICGGTEEQSWQGHRPNYQATTEPVWSGSTANIPHIKIGQGQAQFPIKTFGGGS